MNRPCPSFFARSGADRSLIPAESDQRFQCETDQFRAEIGMGDHFHRNTHAGISPGLNIIFGNIGENCQT